MNRRNFIASASASIIGASCLQNVCSDPAGVYPWDLEEQKRIIDIFRRRTYYFKKERIAREFTYGVMLDSNPDILWGIGSNSYSACMHLEYPNDLGIINGSVAVYPRKKADHLDMAQCLGVGIGQEIIKGLDICPLPEEKNGYRKYDLTINNLVWDHKKIQEEGRSMILRGSGFFIAPFSICGSHERPPLELVESKLISE